MDELDVVVRTGARGPVVELDGVLAFDTAPDARIVLDGLVLRPGGRLLLDLGGLSLCDSTGIALLIAAHRQALAAGATLVLAAVPEHLERAFGILGLDAVFTVSSGVRDAADGRP